MPIVFNTHTGERLKTATDVGGDQRRRLSEIQSFRDFRATEVKPMIRAARLLHESGPRDNDQRPLISGIALRTQRILREQGGAHRRGSKSSLVARHESSAGS